MKGTRISHALALALALCALASSADAQGKGKGRGGGGPPEQKPQSAQGRGAYNQAQPPKARGPERVAMPSQSRGRGNAAAAGNAHARGNQKPEKIEKVTGRENALSRPKVERAFGGEVARANEPHESPRGRFVRTIALTEVRPVARGFVVSERFPERLVGTAVALAFARGVPENALVIAPTGNHVFVRNRSGVVLLDLDDARANNLGAWRVVPFDGTVAANAPSFCRSGAGHPVWGRQWCIDKGFGLGTGENVRWGRAVDLGDVVIQRAPATVLLTSNVLPSILGDVVFNRLATHALTLGLVDPLVGRWLGEPTGPQVLLVTSGSRPVAEFVDVNRDGRADNLFVALRPW